MTEQDGIIERISLSGKEIILIGTAHISSESVALVERVLLEEKPDVVGVELDKERLYQLKNPQKWQHMDIAQVIREGKAYLLLLNLMLSNMQKRLGDELGVQPGSEMIKALDLAAANQMPVLLLDRDVKVTMKRAMKKMSFIEKMRIGSWLVASIFGYGEGEKLTKETVEKLKDRDLINKLMQQMGEKMPSIKEVLVDERDQFIAHHIHALNAKKIVAVVGAGHLNGVKKELTEKFVSIESSKSTIQQLNLIPEKKSMFGLVVKYLIPALFFIILIWAFVTKGFPTLANALVSWVLITGTFSALGALLARSHWKTVIVSFVVAPITTIHPALAAGWFAGLAEAKIRIPQVKDFESLKQLNSFRDFNKNRVTHILIVTAYTNIGATVGTLIGLPLLASLLG